jgi:hypothetical protein
MGAPTGNQFWKNRTKHGRDRLFSSPKALWEASCEYFEWVEANPLWENKVAQFQGAVIDMPVAKMRAMTLDGLWFYLKIGNQTWYEYKSREDFSEVITDIEQVIRNQKFTGAAADLLNPNIIARDLGLKDTSAHDHTSSDGSMTPKSAIDASKLSTAALEEILNAQNQ